LKIVAMQENEVAKPDHGLSGHPAETRADKEPFGRAVYPASGWLLNSLDEFVNTRRSKNVVTVA
jgi:hypothetical protein